MKKFISLLLVLCLVVGLASTSMAAAKKKAAKKSSGASDKVAQILKNHKPENATNAQTLRNALSKYKQTHVLIITLTDDHTLIFELISTKDGKSKGKDYLELGEKYIDNPLLLWDKMKKAHTFAFAAMGRDMSFFGANSYYDSVSFDDFIGGADNLYDLFDNNGTFTFTDSDSSAERNTATMPFILQYYETGV